MSDLAPGHPLADTPDTHSPSGTPVALDVTPGISVASDVTPDTLAAIILAAEAPPAQAFLQDLRLDHIPATVLSVARTFFPDAEQGPGRLVRGPRGAWQYALEIDYNLPDGDTIEAHSAAHCAVTGAFLRETTPEDREHMSLVCSSRTSEVEHLQARARQMQSAGLLLAQMANEKLIHLPKKPQGWRLPIITNNGNDLVLTREGSLMVVAQPGPIAGMCSIAASLLSLLAVIVLAPSAGGVAKIGVALFILQALVVAVSGGIIAAITGVSVAYGIHRLATRITGRPATWIATLGGGPDSPGATGDLGPKQIGQILQMALSEMDRLKIPLPPSLRTLPVVR